jgi:hypothetical protein
MSSAPRILAAHPEMGSDQRMSGSVAKRATRRATERNGTGQGQHRTARTAPGEAPDLGGTARNGTRRTGQHGPVRLIIRRPEVQVVPAPTISLTKGPGQGLFRRDAPSAATRRAGDPSNPSPKAAFVPCRSPQFVRLDPSYECPRARHRSTPSRAPVVRGIVQRRANVRGGHPGSTE